MNAQPPLLAVIEDDFNVLAAMRLLLETQGFRVVAGEDEGPILEHLAQGGDEPRAILADYRLRQGHTGIEAVRRIRATVGRTIPGLLITGDTSGAWLDDAQAQRLMVLQKPVLPVQLTRALAKVLA